MNREMKMAGVVVVVLMVVALGLHLVKGSVSALDGLANFSPMMALTFMGAVLLPRAVALWVPMGVLLVGDALLGRLAFGEYFWVTVPTYVVFGLCAFWGWRVRGGVGAWGLLGRVVVCSVGFYVVANTAAWLASPGYAKTLAGWWQSQTVGLPGFMPSWMFLRNALVGDVLFSGAMLCAAGWGFRIEKETELAFAAEK